jgi:hypothetical protein
LRRSAPGWSGGAAESRPSPPARWGSTGFLPAKVRVRVHELAHALGIGYGEHGRAQAEVLVDTATYIVCAGAGLDVSGESVPYIAGWGQDDAAAAVRRFAETIDAVSRRIEHAIDAERMSPGSAGELHTA